MKTNLSTLGLCVVYGEDDYLIDPYEKVKGTLKKNFTFKMGYRNHIARKIDGATSVFDTEEVYNKVLNASSDDIKGSIGEKLGFEKGIDPDDGFLSEPLINNYSAVAHANKIITMAALMESTEIYADYITSMILKHRIGNILESISKNIDEFRSIMHAEKVPDLGKLLKQNKISFEDILSLRNSKNGEQFRKWFSSVEANDKNLVQRYYKELINPLSQTEKVKTIKVVTYSIAGLLFSALNPVIGGLANTSLNSLDAFLIDKLIDKMASKSFY